MPASMAKGSDDSMEPTLGPFSVQAQRKQHRRDGIARSTTGYRYVKFNGFIVERLQACTEVHECCYASTLQAPDSTQDEPEAST